MGLLLAPYSNAMRIGQGFNSYTQEICIDDAVIIDPGRAENTLTNDGTTMSGLASLMGRPSAWVREKEVQLDLALLEQRENDRTKEKARMTEGKEEQESHGKQLIPTKGKNTADEPPEDEIAPEEFDTSEVAGEDTKKGDTTLKSAPQKAREEPSAPTKSLKVSAKNAPTAQDGKAAGAAGSAGLAKPDEADKAPVDLALYEANAEVDKPSNDTVDFETYKANASIGESNKVTERGEGEGSVSDATDADKSGKGQAKEDPNKTRARTAAEIKSEGEQAAARQRAEEKAARETAAAKKRAEARATAAASLKAYTQEQMAAIRREKFGEDAGHVAPPQGSKARYHYAETGRRGPSQIVTYSSRFVDSLSDITDDMNISGSLSIKYGAVGGSGRGAFIDSDKFRESDLNFYISVKVINQSINYKDALVYNPVRSVGDNVDRFNKVFGDSFISGFLEGGEFNALVSMKVLNKAKMTDIQAEAKVALTVGAAEISAEGNVDIAKKNISNNTETTIQVSWSGGGFIKPLDQTWDVDTLTVAAARFPDLVAISPQRTYAILTKYETLRSFVALQPAAFSPLQYAIAQVYTNALMDTYMEYKSLYKKLAIDIGEIESGTSVFKTEYESGADETLALQISDATVAAQKASRGSKDVTMENAGQIENTIPFPKSAQGLDAARRAIRAEMVKIVNEVDQITRDPKKATDSGRSEPFQTPIAFRERLPKLKKKEKAPVVPLSVQEIKPAEVTDLSKHPRLYVEMEGLRLELKEQTALEDITKSQPAISDNLRLTGLCGSTKEGSFFSGLEFLRPNFVISELSVEVEEGAVAALTCRYTNGLVLSRGCGRTGGSPITLKYLGSKERIVACSIETGRPSSGSTELRVTAVRLHTNRGRSLLGQAADYTTPGSSGRAYRGGVQYQDLTLVDFDPPMGKASLRGFWGRSRDGTKGPITDGIWRLGAIWGDLEALSEELITTDVTEDVHEEYRVRTGSVDTTSVNSNLVLTDALRSEQIVKFPAACLEIPRIIWSLSGLTNEGRNGIRAGTETSKLTKDQFTLTPFTWQGFAASYIRASWMKIPSNPAAQFQLGRVNTEDIPRQYNRDRGGLPEAISFYVSFSTPYKVPPTVLVWFTHIDVPNNANVRTFTNIRNVTTDGFLLNIETWQGSQIFSAKAGWVAYNPAAPGIASGTQDSYFVDVPAIKVSFAAGTFKKAPQMFVGFRHLDVEQMTPVRLQAQASNVTATDFDIASGSWSRPGMPASKVWGCNHSWLAIE